VLQSAAVTEQEVRNGSGRDGSKVNQDSAPYLVMRLSGQALAEVPLRDGLRIGRGPDNDIVLPGTRSSRYHARIDRQGNHYFVSNIGSQNHTWVNGISLIGQRRLRHGDRIVLGEVELIFHAGAPMAGASSRVEARSAAGRSSTPSGSAAADPGPGAGNRVRGKPSRRRRAYTITPAGVVVLLVAVVVAAYFVIPGLFQPQPSTPEPTPTPSAVLPSPAPTMIPTPSALTPVDNPAAASDDRLGQAQALALKSRFEEAIEIYQAVAREDPDDVRPEIGWAWALLLDGWPDQALLHARRASELAPQSAEAGTVLARACVEMQDTEGALSWAQRAIRAAPQSAEAHAVLALALLLDDRTEEATEQAELALEADPDSAEAHRVRGLLYQAVDRGPQQAAAELQGAADLQPDLWLRYHELGLALLQIPDYDGAIVALTNALVLRHKATTYTALGRTYYQMGQYDQAKSFLEQSLSAGAWDADTYALLAALNAQQARCEDARVYYDQALKQDPAHRLAREARTTCEGALPTPGAATAIAAATIAAPTPEPPAPTLTGQVAFPVWNRDVGQYDTYLAQVDGSERRLVVEEMHQPALRPDGQWLAVNGERPQHMNLFVVRPDGSDLLEISNYIEDGQAAWSPDGQALVLGSTRHPDRQSRLYVIDQVPYDGTRAEDRTLLAEPYELLGQRPTWTSDGRVVYNGCDHTATPPLCGLFVISAEPGPQTPEPLTDDASDTAPAVYGHRLLFMSNRDGNWEIYVLELGTTEPQRLTRNTANDGLPVWSPDGQMLAFVSDQGGVWAVWAMNADGSQRRKLFELGGAGLAFDWQEESISWAP
jgi:tetratricopeptide (TPR) repeat protein